MGLDKNVENPWGDGESEEDRLERERLEKEKLEQEKLERVKLELERLERDRKEKERLEKERFERLKVEAILYPNNSLFMITSWSDLLGYPILGMYVHHPVSKIESDPVLFLSGYDYSIETPQGTLHYLFGLGYYFLKFELESGKYITDNRIITGLALPDFVYDHMATSASVTLEEDPDVIIAEKVVKVPIDLSNKSEDHLTFIKGALMRNVFIPNKAIFLEMMEQIKKSDTYQTARDGHMILSAHWDYFDQLLVSEKLKTKTDSSYLKPTAGLMGIKFAAEHLLEDTIYPMNLSIVEENIGILKMIYSNLEFDPMYLFSLIEQAAIKMGPEMLSSTPQRVEQKSVKKAKASVFISAEGRIDEFISWPVGFARKSRVATEVLAKAIEPPLETIKPEKVSPAIPTVEGPELRQENFEVDALKSERVESKPLPSPPKPDIKEILRYLTRVLEQNYEMPVIGRAFELARESARQMGVSATTLHQAKIWEMSKYANIYLKKNSGFGLSPKEQDEMIRKVGKWLFDIEEEERLERERIEQARLEKERLERLERERIEREKQEKARKERERLEQIRLEKERETQRMLEKQRLEKIKKEKEEAARIERERLAEIERRKMEEIRLEQERLRKKEEELEALEKEKEELKKLTKERKQKEKEAKKEAKKRIKLEKQKKKLEKERLKEQEKLKKL